MDDNEIQAEKNELLELYKKVKAKKDAIAVKDTGLEGYYSWVVNEAKTQLGAIDINPKGLGKTSLLNLLSRLKTYADSEEEPSEIEPNRGKRNAQKSKAQLFLKVADYYLEQKKRVASPESLKHIDYKSRIENEEPLETWFFYFLKLSLNSNVPKIARTILRTYTNQIAHLEQLEDVHSVDLYGTYEKMGSHVESYDLKDEEHLRGCNFKVHRASANYSLLAGIFTTYDLEDIRSGSLIMEKVDAGSCGGELKPIVACYYEARDNYQLIPDCIQDYLFEKVVNYGTVPKRIADRETLSVINKKRPLLQVEHRKRRFFDFQKSKLFLASQQTSFSDFNKEHEKQDKIIEEAYIKLKAGLPQIEIIQRVKKELTDANNQSFNILKELKRTKYFVLVVGRHEKASFSTVMLGWAMAYCMHILLIYKKGTVSKRFLALSQLKIEQIEVEEIEPIRLRDEIMTFVKTNR